MHRSLTHSQIPMGPEGLILLSGKPADTTLPVVPLKSMHWLQIYIVIRGIWVQTKGKRCKMLYRTIFPQSFSEKKSHAGQGPVMLRQSTRPPPSSAWLGRCSILPAALISVEKKLFPSLFLLSCSASRPLLQSSELEEAVHVRSCWGPGSCRAAGQGAA